MRVTNDNREAVFAAIRQMHCLGKTAAEAAAALGMTVDRVNLHRRDIGLPPFDMPPGKNTRPDAWTAEQDAELLAAIEAGLSASEAAERIGRPLRSITTRRSRLDLPFFKRRPLRPRPKQTWTPDRVRTLAELRAKGVSFRHCAPKLQTTRGAIAGACDRYLSQELPA